MYNMKKNHVQHEEKTVHQHVHTSNNFQFLAIRDNRRNRLSIKSLREELI